MMSSTPRTTALAASRTVSGTTRDAGSQALRAAGRQLLATAGNQVLKAAVDRAVGKVDQAAGRLDAVARGPRPSSGPPVRKTSEPSSTSGSALRARVGASLHFVVQRAVLLLQLVQRLVRQLLDALARRLRRGKADETDQSGDEANVPDHSADEANVLDHSGEERPRPASQPGRRPRPGTGPSAAAQPRRRVVGAAPSGRAGHDD